MDLEGIMLSEMTIRKANTVCFHLYVESKNIKIIDIQSRMVLPGNGVERNGEIFIKEYKLPFIR